MRDVTLRTTFAAVLVLALTGWVGTAPANAQQQGQQQGQQQAQAEEIPQPELDRYAAAYMEISQIRQGLQQKLQNAESQEERQSIQQEANQTMQAILQEHDISVQRYRQITEILNSDQEQRQEFTAMVQEKRSGEESGESSGGG